MITASRLLPGMAVPCSAALTSQFNGRAHPMGPTLGLAAASYHFYYSKSSQLVS